MKYLICGRTGRGKDTLAQMLEKHGLKVLKSYSTREPRYKGEDTHIFISKEKAATIKDKIATTVINDNEYFATRKQLDECDIYIIDPNGIKELVENCPDISFHVIYMTADEDVAKNRAINRADDTEKESEIYANRSSSEDEQFKEFENLLKERKPIAPNCCAIHNFSNNGDKDHIENFASYLYGFYTEFKNLMFITDLCVTLGILNQSELNHVDVEYEEDDITTVSTPYELFVDLILSDENGFNRLMHAYLSSTTIYDDI